MITAFEQASIAWHRLWALDSIGSGKGKGKSKSVSISIQQSSHRREASQQLTRQLVKRGRIGGSESPEHENIDQGMDRALLGLQRIFHDPNAKPRSEGQASALRLVHNPSPRVPLLIVLPTSSGKSALFFSVAAMTTTQQIVIVVVPFAQLVKDIVVRA